MFICVLQCLSVYYSVYLCITVFICVLREFTVPEVGKLLEESRLESRFPETDLARGVLKVVGNLGAGSGDTGSSTREWEYAGERY